jgi:hypothetical protein
MTDIEQRAHDLALEAASKFFDIELQSKIAEAKAVSQQQIMPIIKIEANALYSYYIECYKSFKDKLETEP